MTTTTDRHVAYTDKRYQYTDEDGNAVYGPERTVYCGDWKPGEGTQLCNPCFTQAKKDYPQGWAYYPGDVCRHGKYTGGCGIDHICQFCEDGD